jgi:branched-chain amino acid transport system ATP-binding protein
VSLRVSGLHAWYDRSHVLQGVDLEVGQGEIVCLIGRNGAGKTTTLKSIMGLVAKVSGDVHFEGRALLPESVHRRYALGIGYIPEERRIVPGLTVRENLQLGLLAAPKRRGRESAVVGELCDLFPRLGERLAQEAVTLSGGEQQMLAIARALASDPRMLLVDEPSEGIMPLLVEEMFKQLARLKDAGKSILLVEQNVEWALSLADRAYIMDQGVIVHASDAASLRADAAIQQKYCSV